MDKSLKEIKFDSWIVGWKAGSSTAPYDATEYSRLEEKYSFEVAEEYRIGWEDGVRARNKAYSAAQDRIGYALSEGYDRIRREHRLSGVNDSL